MHIEVWLEQCPRLIGCQGSLQPNLKRLGPFSCFICMYMSVTNISLTSTYLADIIQGPLQWFLYYSYSDGSKNFIMFATIFLKLSTDRSHYMDNMYKDFPLDLQNKSKG